MNIPELGSYLAQIQQRTFQRFRIDRSLCEISIERHLRPKQLFTKAHGARPHFLKESFCFRDLGWSQVTIIRQFQYVFWPRGNDLAPRALQTPFPLRTGEIRSPPRTSTLLNGILPPHTATDRLQVTCQTSKPTLPILCFSNYHLGGWFRPGRPFTFSKVGSKSRDRLGR